MDKNTKSASGKRAADGFLGVITRRPVAITMFMVALLAFGIVSLLKLPTDLLPEISYPTLTVRTNWSGAAPEDVEERVSERVQEALSTLDDLVNSTSISRAGTSDVVLEFDWGTPMSLAVQDVREKLDGVFLPRDAERPLILRYDPNLDPILRIGLRAPEGKVASEPKAVIEEQVYLRWLAENRIKRELEAMLGIAAVQIRGGLQEEIRVRLDPFKLAAQRIEASAVATRLAQENINASSGSLQEGSSEYLVRTVNQFRRLDEILDLPLSERGAATIRVRDVGSVQRTYEKRDVVSRIGGAESVEIAIYREAGANIVDLAETIKARIFGTPEQQAASASLKGQDQSMSRVGERNETDFLAWRMRDEMQMEVLSDQSVFIRDAIKDVIQAALIGAILAVFIIWLFLRQLSATVIISVAIPLSIAVTFAPMFMGGVSLNIMSLGGLALGVGMLVDNAIVVLESITRCREEGDSLRDASVRGLSEVIGAVSASTLTTVCVFAPIVFVAGIAGQIFGDQALTVVSSLLVSLIIAVLFIPMLASLPFLSSTPGAKGIAIERVSIGHGLKWNLVSGPASVLTAIARTLALVLGWVIRYVVFGLLTLAYKAFWYGSWPLRIVFNSCWSALDHVYPKLLKASLRVPLLVILGMGALTYFAVLRLPQLGIELLPEIHQGEFTAHTKMRVGNPLLETDAVMRELDRRIQALPGVASTALTVGVEKETLTREIEGPHTSRLTVRLEEGQRDTEHEERSANLVRDILASHPSINSVEITRPTPFALEAPIAVEVRGYDLELITQVGEEVKARLEALEGLTDVRSTTRPGHPEARVTFDREKMLKLGLDLSTVSNMVRDQVLGNVSTRFHQGDERIDIRVQGDEAVLNTLQAVLDMPVNPSSESPVSLRTVAEIDIIEGPAEIRRIGNTRAVVVSATGTGLDLGGLARRIQTELDSMQVSDDVEVRLGGQKREMDEAQQSLQFALLLAVFLVYVVMASQFESLIQPLVILLTVPLAGVGVIFALDVLSIPLSVVVFIGLIMLAGIVVNNAIVLVDRINQSRSRGMELFEAIVDAGSTRLRPILMTTATTVLGLLPMTGWLAGVPFLGQFGAGEGAELRAPMAVAVITGLISSTFLTLIVIPVAYSLLCRRNKSGAALVPAMINPDITEDAE